MRIGTNEYKDVLVQLHDLHLPVVKQLVSYVIKEAMHVKRMVNIMIVETATRRLTAKPMPKASVMIEIVANAFA